MTETELQGARDAHSLQNRLRTLQFKAKRPRAELDDYDLSIFNFIQESKSGRADTAGSGRPSTNPPDRQWQ